MLENLTRDLGAPCVMDIKIGARTYGPDATDANKKKKDAKYQGTKVTACKGSLQIGFLEKFGILSQPGRPCHAM